MAKIKRSKKSVSNTNSKGPASLWLYGIHAVESALKNKKRHHKRILCTEKHFQRFYKIATPITPEIQTATEIAKMLPEGAVHQGVALLTTPLPLIHDIKEIKKDGPLVILDQVTDPHNVGAIMRSALAFNFKAIVVTENQAPNENAIIAKTASGALEHLPIITVKNLSRTMQTIKKDGYWCIGMDGYAETSINQYKASEKTALIMGAEGKGLRKLTKEQCDVLVKLPINPAVESLNVSNAAAVAMYEISKNLNLG